MAQSATRPPTAPEALFPGSESSGRDGVEQFFRRVPSGLSEALPTGVCVTFDLSAEGWRRSWTLRRSEDGVGRLVARAPSPCDCRLACTADDFLALVTGRLDPRQGFLEGRLDVEGDVGLVLQLHRCLVA